VSGGVNVREKFGESFVVERSLPPPTIREGAAQQAIGAPLWRVFRQSSELVGRASVRHPAVRLHVEGSSDGLRQDSRCLALVWYGCLVWL
jgi:hypothetical protein